ncbi:hypothetical protein [Paenarthrobacter sp. PH39-S1]|uniref:hypothetical protein n=1 Tax=Paenarthrobacter sp. PH39-S1 TaxID=3046204 RepID=UPI0024BA2FE2|nr:hypothetical protein [Paenarthrobacter sp. PH39-S1]MDJ0358087.1 hypothetical protein [Paenarthrobacter sp. PH39-S1]
MGDDVDTSVTRQRKRVDVAGMRYDLPAGEMRGFDDSPNEVRLRSASSGRFGDDLDEVRTVGDSLPHAVGLEADVGDDPRACRSVSAVRPVR